MLEQLRNLFFEYSNAIVFVPLLIAAVNYKKYSAEFKPIFYYLLLATVTQAVSFALWKQSINNFPILHVYTITEYLLLLWFYRIILKGFIPDNVFTALSIIFPLFSVVNSLYLESIFTFNTYGRSLEALIFIFLSLSWFVKMAATDDLANGQTRAIGYINSGLLIYFAGSIAVFAYSTYVQQMEVAHRINIWTVHTFLVVQLYILIAVGLWKAK